VPPRGGVEEHGHGAVETRQAEVDRPDVPGPLLLERRRGVVGRHVGEHALAQQAPHLQLVGVGAGAGGRRELAERAVLVDLVLAQQEVLRAALRGQPRSACPFLADVRRDLGTADVGDRRACAGAPD
jgi:hypothetical protein